MFPVWNLFPASAVLSSLRSKPPASEAHLQFLGRLLQAARLASRSRRHLKTRSFAGGEDESYFGAWRLQGSTPCCRLRGIAQLAERQAYTLNRFVPRLILF